MQVAPSYYPIFAGGRAHLLETQSLELVVREASHWHEHLVSEHPRVEKPMPPALPCKTDPRFVVLNVTHACNLRCRYCFVDGSAATMTEATARHAVRTLQPGTVGFFGGEPLLAPHVILAAAEEARQIDPSCRFAMTTNGTRILQHLDLLRELKPGLVVSLDGDPARHDRLRPLADGSGSHADALAGLRSVASLGLRATLRGTFDGDGCDLAAELEALNALCDDGLAGHVSIEPASTGEGCVCAPMTVDHLRAMEPQYERAARWAIDRIRAGRKARWHHLQHTLRTLLTCKPQWCECGAGRGYVTVAPDGTLHACHREGSRIGALTEAGVTWEASRDAWLDNRLTARDSCALCGLRFVCGGGCRIQGLRHHGSVRRADPVNCELTRLRVQAAVLVLDALGPELAARAAMI